MPAWLGDWAERAYWWVAVGSFLAIAAAESCWPDRPLRNQTVMRWLGHFTLYGASLALLTLTAPSDLATALFGSTHQRLIFAAPGGVGWAALIAGVLFADLLMYAIHRIEHRVFLLWRFHAVHHADTDVDVTTAFRQHPGQFLLNSFVVTFVLLGLGAPAWLLPIYSLILLSIMPFQHMNSHMPSRLERLVGFALVTPGMHRVHHSVHARHYEANFGAVFSFWDRLFGTYCGLDQAQLAAVEFGIPGFTALRYSRIHWAWVLPFVLSRGERAPHQGLGGASGHTREGKPTNAATLQADRGR
jgi:sterol desaturase/sphingolipid hydroxylase (fatty acid hydroxylase superfamily)